MHACRLPSSAGAANLGSSSIHLSERTQQPWECRASGRCWSLWGGAWTSRPSPTSAWQSVRCVCGPVHTCGRAARGVRLLPHFTAARSAKGANQRWANCHHPLLYCIADASIWLYQFIRAMRTPDGEMMKNAHLLGFLRRICKCVVSGQRAACAAGLLGIVCLPLSPAAACSLMQLTAAADSQLDTQ